MTTSSKKQGEGSTDVITVKKAVVPNGWPTVHTTEELNQIGKLAGKYRVKAGLSNGNTVAFGSTSSTYRSKGSTGKADTDKTLRDITVKGKVISWQVYPVQASMEDLYPYFMYIDLYQNYVRSGGSTSGIMIDAIMLTLSDVDTCHNILTQLAGVTEEAFAAYVKMCETMRDYWQVVTGQVMPIGTSNFDTTVGDGSTAPAPKAGEVKQATDMTSFSWD